uniref:Sequestosome-1 UBA domain-containing protein n=1 Tax=Romanomermis culicivorax TaxID=13658 RepID=A0A915KLI9_ROMCU
MFSMGFHNDKDWLRQLLYRKNGDIAAVLDTIQPKV